MAKSESPEEILAELTEARRRLAEADELIRAIRQGEVDSLVVSGPRGNEVYPPHHTLCQQVKFQQALMDIIPSPVYYMSLAEEFLGCNRAFADMVGRPKEEIITRKVADLVPPDLASRYRQQDEELISRGGVQEYETDFRFGDGQNHTVLVRKNLFYQPDGSVGGIISLITDITARKQAEAEHERLAAIVKGSEDAIFGKTLEGRITDWNPAAERLYGYTATEIKGKSVLELAPPERRAEMDKILAAIRQGKSLENLPTVRRRKDGTLVEVSLTVSPIKDVRGSVVGASSIDRDITVLNRFQRDLQRELAIKSALADLHPPLISPDTTIEDVTNLILARARRLTASEHGFVSTIDPVSGDNVGHTLTEMLAGQCRVAEAQRRIAFPKGADGSYAGLYGHSLNTGEAFFTNTAATHPATRGIPAGHIPIQNFLSVPVFLGAELVGQIALANSPRDYIPSDLDAVSRLGEFFALAIQRLRATEALQQQRDQAQQYLDIAGVILVALAGDGRISMINRRGGELLGYEEEELLGRNWFETCLRPDDQPRVKKIFHQVMAGNVKGHDYVENIIITRDGRERLVAFHNTIVRDGHARIIGTLSSGEDITAQRQAEAALKEALSLQEATLEASADGVLAVDLHGGMVIYNKKFAEMWSIPEAVLQERHRGLALRVLKDLVVDPETFMAGVEKAHGQPDLATHDMVSLKDGRTFEWYSLPQRLGGRIVGRVWNFRDITARLETEERLSLLVQQVPAVLFRGYADGSVDFFDDKIEALTGYPKADFDSRRLRWLDLILPEDQAQVRQELLRALHDPDKSYIREYRIRRRDGELAAVRSRGRIFQDGRGRITYISGLLFDVTDLHRAQEQIQSLHTLLKAVKEINEALLRVQSEPDLFQQTCDLLLQVPYIRFVWIGLVDPESPELKVAAHAGHEAGYLSVMKVTWDDTEWGQGPSGEAIRTGGPVVIADMTSDPRVLPWREEALQRGYRATVSLPLVYQKEVIGILKVYSGDPHAFGPEEMEFLAQVAGDIAVGVKSLRVEQEFIESIIRLQVILHQTVEAIGIIAELRDPYTAGHQCRVTKLACALAEEMGLDSQRLEGLKVAGSLHDLGKITIPAEILSRPGRLSDNEMMMVRTHAEASYEVLKKISFPWPVAEICRQHHERADGSGYPRGLAGEEILPEARILAVADVVEAMASHRPYRPALGIEAALEEITRQRAILYDPVVVDACVRLFAEKRFTF